MPEAKSPKSKTQPDEAVDLVDDAEKAGDDAAAQTVADEADDPTPSPAKSSRRPDPVQAEKDRQKAMKERQKELKEQEKVDAAARRADAKKFAQAEKDAAKAVKAAAALQRKADKAKATADKLAAVAEEANEAVLNDATDQANARAEKAASAATSAADTAGKLQKEATAAQKKANKLRAGMRATGKDKVEAPDSRQWVPPAFITVGLLGVMWLVVYYVSVAANIPVPYLTDLGGWNVIIGMGLMAASFGIATLWK